LQVINIDIIHQKGSILYRISCKIVIYYVELSTNNHEIKRSNNNDTIRLRCGKYSAFHQVELRHHKSFSGFQVKYRS
jgi:hypothetical protein